MNNDDADQLGCDAYRNVLSDRVCAIIIFFAASIIQFSSLAVAQDENLFQLSVSANPAQVGQAVEMVARFSLLPGQNEISPADFLDGDITLCANVDAVYISGFAIFHCVASFSSVGVHGLVATSGMGPLPIYLSTEVQENVIEPFPFDAAQTGLTGSWFSPYTDGQGFEFVVYPDSEGNAYFYGGWFTYLADRDGPYWLTLQGPLDSAHGNAYSQLGVYESDVGNFAAPPQTESQRIGDATLTFHDCAHATLDFSLDGSASGTIPLVRLTAPTGCSMDVPAAPPSPPPAHYNDALHSGVWYQPETAGQGLTVDLDPAQSTFFALWYTYAPGPNDPNTPAYRWFALQANYTPGDLSLTDVPIYITEAGVFDQPSDVTREIVGSANVTFISSNEMTLDYAFTSGELAGESGSIDEHNPLPAPECE